MAIAFDPSLPLEQVSIAAAAINCKVVPDGHGGAIIQRPADPPTAPARTDDDFSAHRAVHAAGYCDTCGNWCGALLRGICAWCRSQYRVIDR